MPVSAPFNEMIFDQVLTSNDYGDCSKQTLRTISFHLKNENGDLVPMHGSHLSFSIIFSRQPTDI